jgi:hypothetical protein
MVIITCVFRITPERIYHVDVPADATVKDLMDRLWHISGRCPVYLTCGSGEPLDTTARIDSLCVVTGDVVFAHCPCVPGRTTSHEDSKVTKIRVLADMGYPEEDCRRALEAALYNIDRAADYLIGGNIPKPLELFTGRSQ